MSKIIRLKMTVEAEILLNKMKEKGISEDSAIAKGLWLLDQANKGNLALLDEQGNIKNKIIV